MRLRGARAPDGVRIMLDTTFALRGPSGTSVYMFELERALTALGVEVVTVANERRGRPGGGPASSARNLAADLAWTERRLPRLARRAGADVIHHPLPACSRSAATRQVVTVHDVAFHAHPDLFDKGFRAWASRSHRAAARRAGAVVCVSKDTAGAVERTWGIVPDRIVVARHGPGQSLPARSRPATPAHILYVGDNEPRKRVALLRDAHAALRARRAGDIPQLVLVGSGHAAGPGVDVVTRVTPGRLADLYASAALLVHPSVAEGFGLTLLEAMATGTPLLAARSDSALEVCGEAALLTDAGDAVALAGDIERLLGDDSLRTDLSRRGLERAQTFSWAQCAREHLRAYTLALR